MKPFFFIFIALTSNLHALGQFFNTGVEPFSVKWKIISYEDYNIIFPSDAQKAAIKFAGLIQTVNANSTREYSYPNQKVNIIVHNKSILSNGYVAWAPKRMEIITHQPTTTNSQPWLKQLATHENRHYTQLSNLNDGVFYPLAFLFGEQAVGAAAGFIPMWFLEGDAVAFETASSNSGRGRQADFYNYYRSHYLTKYKPFKYDKWLLGSYKDNIPNHYSLGYQMVTYGKLKYGKNIWANTFSYTTRNPFTLFPFYFGLKKEAGVSRKTLHDETFKFLDSLWRKSIPEDSITNTIKVSSNNHEYTDYRYSRLLNDTLLISYKTSLSKIPEFVTINLKNREESKLFNPGFLTSRPAVYNGRIYYCEYKPHPRWEMKDYSVIKVFDIHNEKIKSLSSSGKYFSPAFNPMDNNLYAIERTEDGIIKLIKINDFGGIQVVAVLPEEYDPFELFVSDSGRIYLAVVSDQGKSILEFSEKIFCPIFGPSFLDINSFSAYGDFLFFNLSLAYNENIYCYNKLNNRIYKIVNTSFGSKDPIYINKTNSLLFSEFSSNGFFVANTKFDTLGKAIVLPFRNDDPLTKYLDENESLNIDTLRANKNDYEVKDYRGIETLINVHSWIPFFAKQSLLQLNESPLMLGATLLSQNLTSSSTLIAGYGYNNNHNFLISYQYDGFWPKLRFNLESYEINGTTNGVNKFSATVMIPYTIKNDHYSSYFAPLITSTFTNETFYLFNSSSKYIQYLEIQGFYSFLERMAKRDLRPRLGIILDMKYKSTPTESTQFGKMAAFQAKAFVPGLTKNHSLMTSFAMQKQWYKHYLYSNTIPFPRGYMNYPSTFFQSISMDYTFPVIYPDMSVGSVGYLKRLSANLFLDLARNKYPNNTNLIDIIEENMYSFGFDFYLDFHLFRTRYPLRFKFQQGWMGKDSTPFSSFGLVTDIYSAFGIGLQPRELPY